MPRAALGLGSNQGDKAAHLRTALHRLDRLPGVDVVAASSLYRTEPWGDTGQDWFVNACAVVDTRLTPRDLLACCLDVERIGGRVRDATRRWGPRPIDIDILLYEGVRMRDADLELPHPRLLERSFVLIPLAEIAPDWIVEGHSVADAAARSEAGGVRRLGDAVTD